MDNFLKGFSFVAPTMTAILAIFVTYIYGIRRFKYEQKDLQLKKVRETLSNLILIWDEFSELKRLALNLHPSDKIISRIPFLAKGYLKIDKEKIGVLQEAYYRSLQDFKQINISQYHTLNNSLDDFKYVLNTVFIPLTDDAEISLMEKSKILLPILNETCSELKTIVLAHSKLLSKTEQQEIGLLLNTEQSAANTTPKFLVQLANESLDFAEPVTGEEIEEFYSNPTVIWAIDKVLDRSFVKKYFNKGFAHVLKMILIRRKRESLKPSNIETDIISAILKLDISPAESDSMKGNKAFFRILLDVERKITGKNTIAAKKLFVSLNNGSVSLLDFLAAIKKDLTTEEGSSSRA